jgi:hypothetical protein
MFSRWIVTNITSARGTVHCRKTHIPCGDQLVICGLYVVLFCVGRSLCDGLITHPEESYRVSNCVCD